MTNSPTRGLAWRPRGICDWCDASTARASMLCLWNGATAPGRSGVRHAEITFVCGWKCADAVRTENPGWAFRSISFKEFLAQLAADILPSVTPDAVGEVRLKLELVLSATSGWVPAKRVHAKLSGATRTPGIWQSALASLVDDGKVEVKRQRTTPTAQRPATLYRWIGEDSRN